MRPPVACRALGARFHGPRSCPQVALSFDDGPGERTLPLLEALAELGVRATFFLVASRLPGRHDLVHRIVEAGHEVGNHGLYHRDMSQSARLAARELRTSNRWLANATGTPPRLFRPPYGASSAQLVATAWLLGLRTMLWDVDPEDWKGHDAAALRRTVARTFQPGSVVLLHDRLGTAGVSDAVPALPGIVADIRAAGNRLVTCSELLAGSSP